MKTRTSDRFQFKSRYFSIYGYSENSANRKVLMQMIHGRRTKGPDDSEIPFHAYENQNRDERRRLKSITSFIEYSVLAICANTFVPVTRSREINYALDP